MNSSLKPLLGIYGKVAGKSSNKPQVEKNSYIFEFYAIIGGFMTAQQRFDITLDPFELARKGQQFEGLILSRDMSRVVDLIGVDATLRARLDFGIDENGLRFVTGSVAGAVALECQRCLKSFDYELDIQFKLGLVRSETQIAALPDEYEPLLVEDETLLLRDIVEDEIILALPTAPSHSEGPCAEKLAEKTDETAEQQDEDTQRPFANLAELMKKKD